VGFCKRKFNYLIVYTLILVGAFGNIIDSVFYGLFFNDSQASSYFIFRSTLWNLVSWKVVDMLFPFWHGSFLNGYQFGVEENLLFNAIFNVADMAICGSWNLDFFFQKIISINSLI
jgi:signal peptidase II